MQSRKFFILAQGKPSFQHFRLGMRPAFSIEKIVHVGLITDKTQGTVLIVIVRWLHILVMAAFLTPQIHTVVRTQHSDHTRVITMDRRADFYQRICLRRNLSARNLILFFRCIISRCHFFMAVCIQLRLRRSFPNSTGFRFFFFHIVSDICCRMLVGFLCIVFSIGFAIKFQRFSIFLAPALCWSENRSAASYRPYTIGQFLFHSASLLIVPAVWKFVAFLPGLPVLLLLAADGENSYAPVRNL